MPHSQTKLNDKDFVLCKKHALSGFKVSIVENCDKAKLETTKHSLLYCHTFLQRNIISGDILWRSAVYVCSSALLFIMNFIVNSFIDCTTQGLLSIWGKNDPGALLEVGQWTHANNFLAYPFTFTQWPSLLTNFNGNILSFTQSLQQKSHPYRGEFNP